MSYCATKEEGRETLKMIKHLEKGQFGYLSAKKKEKFNHYDNCICFRDSLFYYWSCDF